MRVGGGGTPHANICWKGKQEAALRGGVQRVKAPGRLLGSALAPRACSLTTAAIGKPLV